MIWLTRPKSNVQLPFMLHLINESCVTTSIANRYTTQIFTGADQWISVSILQSYQYFLELINQTRYIPIYKITEHNSLKASDTLF